jgi:hypothetical protein
MKNRTLPLTFREKGIEKKKNVKFNPENKSS